MKFNKTNTNRFPHPPYLATLFIIFSFAVYIYSCTPAPRFRNSPHTSKHAKKTPKHYKEGQILTGKASWYGSDFHGKMTANGEIYDMNKVSAAHKHLPFNTIIEVTNLKNGKEIKVRINDRGPYAKGRILDLSKGAAKKLGMMKTGVAEVRIRIIKLGNK
ncbi:MAG: septal ring lytic transglycosylase RlpA family protein [Candidatus Hatepunaea meridiana]|nr:septal ring lytic transglycosylase RlpA family protein [Candidatus Hatepunaea meridiana]